MSDPGTNEPAASLPTPAAGAGSADLLTDSTDPQELRTLLERARERLSFYESFDKIIAENMRRTGEMMAETVALKEQAAREAERRKEADAAIVAEREHHRQIIASALDEVKALQPTIDRMVTRLETALSDIAPSDEPSGSTPVPSTDMDDAIIVSEPEAERLTPDVPESATPEPVSREVEPEVESQQIGPPATDAVAEVPAASDESPSTIEILAHGVPSAATAIGLQQMLREIDVIRRVDAREFADGELRLHVECTAIIPDESFTDWLAHNSGSLVSRNAKAIELSFG